MTSDIPDGRRVAVRAYPMTILRYAASDRADGRAQSDGRIKIEIATGYYKIITTYSKAELILIDELSTWK